MKAKLSVYKNEDFLFIWDKEYFSHQLGPIDYFIGRAQECHVVLDHPLISRKHAIISIDKDSVTLKKISDMGQIYINGMTNDSKVLSSGDILSIGDYRIHCQIEHDQKVGNAALVEIDESKKYGEDNKLNEKKENQNHFVNKVDSESDTNPSEMPKNKIEEDQSITETVQDDLNEEKKEDQKSDSTENNDQNADGQGSSENNELGGNVQNASLDADPFGSNFQSGDQSGSNPEGNSSGSEDQKTSEQAVVVAEESSNVDDDKTRAINAFVQYVLKMFGEFSPYDFYNIKEGETFIGRDKNKCQIVLDDPEVSSVHAVIKKTKISLTIEDLDSANGTILNGGRINLSDLNKNDEFIVGSTSFTVLVQSDQLISESERLMPVEEKQEIVVEEVVEEGENFDDASLGEVAEDGKQNVSLGTGQGSGSLFSKEALKDPEKRKKLLMYGGALVVLGLFLMDDKKPSKTTDKDKKESLSSKHSLGSSSTPGGPEASPGSTAVKKRKFTEEEKIYLEQAYQSAKKYIHVDGDYQSADLEINKIYQLAPEGYKESALLKDDIIKAYKKKAEDDERKKKEEADKLKKIQIDDLLVKAREAVKEKKADLADGLFVRILELDPEQPDVSILKMEIDEYKKEQQRQAIEKAQKEEDRKRKLSSFSGPKSSYLKKEWFRAINKLEEFLKIKDMDDDLTKEATKMLEDSRENLNNMVSPLLGKARSLKEGQDLKGSYEHYLKILRIDPSNSESLNEMNVIRDTLDNKLKKVYREAIVAESLSLFNDAKEKFQEVQQIAPSDSDYYKKATEKLKNYLD